MRIGRLVLACGLATGCGPDKDPLDQVTTAQTSATSGSQPADSTSTGAPTTGMSGETCPPVDPEKLWVAGSDLGSPVRECDQWQQDCPEGSKCVPYASEGSSRWDSLHCVPIASDAAGVGEPCTVTGCGAEMVDDCGANMVCWDIHWETGFGRCVEQCTGSELSPSCESPDSFCWLFSNQLQNICFPSCHPLDRPCPDGQTCLPFASDSTLFSCRDDGSGEEGQVFDACEFLDGCDPGLFCTAPELAEECEPMAPGCCLPFCDLAAPSCPGVGQECLAWYEEGQAPPKLADVGVCGIPQ